MKNLDLNKDIIILSGEGETGTYERYEGEKTEKAIKAKLEEERCSGDRWARAFVYSYDSEMGAVYVDFETGEQRHIDEGDIV
jgi:hypothetical protein